MEIKQWEGGLQIHEVKAIDKIKKTFTAPQTSNIKQTSLGSMRDQLRRLKPAPIYNWKGYAGFSFVDARGNEGEFDLLIVTHCIVLIIELKDWNSGKITSSGDKWYKNNKQQGRSPVSVTKNKVHLIKNKLERIKNKFHNQKVPWIDFLVVMTGNADFTAITEQEKKHTVSLNEFLALNDEQKFNARFRPRNNARKLLEKISLFDEMLLGNNTQPKPMIVDGYKIDEQIFVHPKQAYSEYLAVSEASNKDKVLLRKWNFNHLDKPEAQTQEGRLGIVSREREVLQTIKHQSHDLYKHCLRSLTSIQKDDITSEYCEIYELPPAHHRFNQFIGKFCANLSTGDRLNISKLLIAKFADLHELKIAHRDLGNHSIWIAPSKEVALSSFISAYHQPIGTVGDNRALLSVNDGMSPKGMKVTKTTTPFQMDVYSIGLLSWHILNAKRLSDSSIEELPEQIDIANEWYIEVLKQALDGQSFSNARDMFDAIKNAEPKNEQNIDFDLAELEPFQQEINHSRIYRDDPDTFKESPGKESYFSNQQFVKAWLNINLSNKDPSIGHKVLQFCRVINKLQENSLEFIPCIRDFGLAVNSSSLFLVTDKVEGQHWNEFTPQGEDKLTIINRLISIVEHLHSLNIAHGDLHPANILIDNQSGKLQIYLVDIPDFSLNEERPFNHRYSPENIDGCTTFERDNFAVMRMSCELLGYDWGDDIIEYPAISDAIKLELEDTQFGFKDLARFKDAVISPNADKLDIIEIVVLGEFKPLTIYPDNGQLYAQIEPNKKNPTEARIKLIGIGGSVDLIFSPEQNQFLVGFAPRQRDSIRHSDIDSSQLTLPFTLNIAGNSYSQLDNLTKRLKDNDEFCRAVNLTLQKEPEPAPTSIVSAQLQQAFAAIEQPTSNDVEIRTAQLWQAILDTETESYPYIEVTDEVFEPKDSDDESDKEQLIIPYHSENDALEQFNKTDIIEALQQNGDNNDNVQLLGTVNLKQSNLSEIRLNKLTFNAKRLKEGDLVYFRTKQDKASYDKRKNALERLLASQGTINKLTEYFEPDCLLPAVKYDITVSDEDFARYDRNDNGNKISLNRQQRDAFTKIVQNGPLSLLQGPPGTGKTEFIAAFVHFLIEKLDVKNILLVSQSHEAVNTAAERIRKHCIRLETPLEVVRFSNREKAVSSGLKDVYSQALVTEKRELFAAEADFRAAALSQALGLDENYLKTLINLELRVFKQIDEFAFTLESLKNPAVEKEDKEGLKKVVSELDTVIREILIEQYQFKLDNNQDLTDAKPQLLSQLEQRFAITPNEARRANALAKVSSDMLDVLATERVNYDEFLARSRHLVTGTCVGIGQRHIGIQNNQYDWVIIDEAARSIASELAIAMQSGKRILLVGDHQQLPPLYSEPHKKALARKLGIATDENDLDSVLQSDFARVFESPFGEQTGAQLLTQYRMAPAIGALVSQCFYKGKLENGDRKIPAIYKHLPKAIDSTVTWLDTSQLHNAYHQEDKGKSFYNRCEATQIINLLEQLAENIEFINKLDKQVKDDEPAIGIICMYGEQKRLIRQKFKEIVWSDKFKSLVKIDTVDSYQGKENRIIILSITRCDKNQSTGFLKLPNRINVALSRAMDKLVIVGSADMWRAKNEQLPLGRVLNFIENSSPIILKEPAVQQNNKPQYQLIKASTKNQRKNITRRKVK